GKIAVPDVDAERHRPRQRRTVEEPRDQAEGQVVDHLVAKVFQSMDRGRAPRPRGAGHEDDALAALPVRFLRAPHATFRHSARPAFRYCRIAAGKWALSIL